MSTWLRPQTSLGADRAAHLEQCSSAIRRRLPLQPDLALFGSGEPLFHDGQVIGTIGVCETFDGLCAKAAVEHVRASLHT